MAPHTCREAVLQGLVTLERRHDRAIFSLEEIVDEVSGTWSRWERSTVTTHVSSHMCRDAPVHHWPDLERVGRGRYRKLESITQTDAAPEPPQPPTQPQPETIEDGYAFERRARRVLSELWSVELQPASVVVGDSVEKRFDLVSPDQRIVGDAKRYTSLKTPAAKWSTIAEYVWLLQKLGVHTATFLVFGGDADVPGRWLARYRLLAEPVAFYFLDDDQLTRL